MRTYLTVAAGAAVLAGMLTTSGCVSKTEYDEVMAANRRLTGTLNTTIAEKRELQSRNLALAADMDTKDQLLSTKDKKLDVLQAANTELQANLTKLQDEYEKLKGRGTGPIIFSALPPLLDKALSELAKKHPDLVEYLPKYGMVKFKADMTFDLGSDVAKPAAIEALQAFANVVNTPEAVKFHIYIAGHTDDVPIGKPDTRRRHPNNWYLSVHRAVAVEEELGKAGIDPSRIAAMGFGEYHPIAPNKPNKKGNEVNRRVELWLVAPDRFLTSAEKAAATVSPPEEPVTK